MATVSLGNIVDDVVDSAGDFWNRFQIEVDDLNTSVGHLTAAGVALRRPVVCGKGGPQDLAVDPSRNPVELFQPLLNDPDTRRAR